MNRPAAAALTLLVLLTSCGSLPAPRDAADSLVLIPVEVRNTADRGFAREFWARFSDGRPEVEVPADGTAYLAVVVRDEGTRLVEVRSRIRSDRSYVAGEEAVIPVGKTFAYRPGACSVAPWALVVGLRKVNEAVSVSGLAAVPATRAQTRAALEAALRDPGLKAWRTSSD